MSIVLGGCLKPPPIDFGITEDTGGHITYALGAARALADLPGVTFVELVTRRFDDPSLGPDYALPRQDLGGGLSIVRIDTGDPRYLTKSDNVGDRPAFTAALIRHLERHGPPDLIHAHFADAAEVARAIRARFGTPHIYTAHSLGIDKANSGLIAQDDACRIAAETAAIAGADGIVASSRDEAERQLMLYAGADPARIHCIAPGARLPDQTAPDMDAARTLIAPFLRNPELPILLAIARPVAKKNLHGLVDIYARDARLRRGANLVILAGLRDDPTSGEAEQREVIRGLLDRMDRHDLYGSLALPKRHTQAAVSAMYALTRATRGLFINPALTEPYGLTLTEAASHGVPVVATDQGGPADIVARFGHGLVADPRHPSAFGDAIAALLFDEARWTGASANGIAAARGSSWAAYAAEVFGLAKDLVRKPTPSGAVVEPRPTELLLCDIDNTLTGCRTGAVDLIASVQARPTLAFGVATGRSLQEAHRLLAEWRYPRPRLMITSVGSEIYWQADGRLTADAGWQRHIDDGWDRRGCALALAGLDGLTAQPPVEQRRHKLSYFLDDPDLVPEIRRRLAMAGVEAHVIYSHGCFLDVLPVRAGKGAAMIWAARAMGIPLSRVFAAGDSGNDLDMLEACPNAILVANHDANLAALAHRPNVYLSRRPHAGGVAEALDRAAPLLEVAA